MTSHDDRVACDELARQVDGEFSELHEALEEDIAYASASTLRVRVDGERSTMIAGANCRLPDQAITDLEVAYRQRLRELPPG